MQITTSTADVGTTDACTSDVGTINISYFHTTSPSYFLLKPTHVNDVGKYFGELPEALHDEFSELVGAYFAVDALEQKMNQGRQAIRWVSLRKKGGEFNT